MSDRLMDERAFRVLTVVDQFILECPLLEADRSLTGKRVVECLDRLAWLQGKPESITVENGSEFCSRAREGVYFRSRRPHGRAGATV